MFEFSNLCRTVELMGPQKRAEIIAEKSPGIIQALSAITESGRDGAAIYLNFILCAIAADGKLDESEYQMIRPMLEKAAGRELTFEEAQQIFKNAGLDKPTEYKRAMDLMVDVIGTLSMDLKKDIVIVCLMVCAVDNRISRKERKWIKQLIR